jgi:hypothetical protein
LSKNVTGSRYKKRECYAQPQGQFHFISFFLPVFLLSYKSAYSVIEQPTKRQWSTPLNHQMNTSNSSTPQYGNHQHQYTPPPQTQLPASFFMQPFRQPMVNSPQQYEVCQTQPDNLQQSYDTQFPPPYHQHANSHRTPSTLSIQLPHLTNAPPIAVAPLIKYSDDRDLTESSDTETHESAHEWQSVGTAKKRKRTRRQQCPDQPNQPT